MGGEGRGVVGENHQLMHYVKSKLCDQSFITRHQSFIARHQSLITRHQSFITRHQSLITRHQSFITRDQSLFTRHQSLITRHQSFITRHQSLITRHQSLITYKQKKAGARAETTVHRHEMISCEAQSLSDGALRQRVDELRVCTEAFAPSSEHLDESLQPRHSLVATVSRN